MIYTDGTHLVADTLDELHLFAQDTLGFKPDWFQSGNGLPRYDLTTQRAAARAIEAGAKMIGIKDIVRISKKSFTHYVCGGR